MPDVRFFQKFLDSYDNVNNSMIDSSVDKIRNKAHRESPMETGINFGRPDCQITFENRTTKGMEMHRM